MESASLEEYVANRGPGLAGSHSNPSPEDARREKRDEKAISGKGDSWQLIYELPRDADGKRKQGRQTVHGTKRDADTKLREILTALDRGGYTTPTKETVGAFLERWLESYGATNASPRTQSRKRL